MKDISQVIAELTVQQREFLLQKMARQNRDTLRPLPAPVPREFPITVPASYAQQRVWFIDQLNPGAIAYNVARGTRFRGPINRLALCRTVDEIVRRHEAFRTTFTASSDGHPMQVITAPSRLQLPWVDLRELEERDREVLVQQLARAESCRPFDLSKGPLLRGALILLGEDDHALLLTIHHIVIDAWSTGLLFKEFTTLYLVYAQGLPSPLPLPSMQYSDYATWQREALSKEQLDAQLAYWRNKLEGLSELRLPLDWPRPPVQTFDGGVHTSEIDEATTTAIKLLARQENVTPFILSLAALKTLFYLYSSQDDIAVGTATGERNRPELEGVMGFITNTQVLRTDLSGNPTFREALGRVRETCLGAFANSDLPFERMVEKLQPDRNLGRDPLFQVMLHFDNAIRQTKGTLPLPGLVTENLEGETSAAMFELWVAISPSRGRFVVNAEFRTALFEAETISRMMGHFRTLLEEIVRDPDQRLNDLTLLSAAEQHQVVSEFNQTRVPYPQDVCLPDLIEAQAARTPEAVALVFEEQQVNYAELNRRANQLAHYLQSCGVGPDVPVALCLERSIEMVVALLGVLKAGGAYVPLDPEYPTSRLATMLAEIKPPVLLLQQRFAAQLPPSASSHMLCLDTEWQLVTPHSERNPSRSLSPQNLAYILYTSGSTGGPKAAMNTHAGICNRLFWMQDVYQLSDRDRVLQKTAFGFDVSLWEFFWPLMTGARLVVAPPAAHRDPSALLELFAKEEITVVHFVPTMLRAFLEQENLTGCGSLREVICSGEALTWEMQEQFFKRVGANLHNLYGPTEAAIDVTYWRCRASERAETVPIGRPIANTQVYVLNERMEAAPVGVAGELYLGGVGLARGYWKRAELTAEKFVPDPFSAAGGSRLYRTGDRVRWRSDGELVFLGRLDEQVKLRGFRIELGEIESELGKHEGVQDSVVITRGDQAGQQRLLAYIVPNPRFKQSFAAASAVDLKEEHLLQWEGIFDQIYESDAPVDNLTFNTVGWNSSYTGGPIPAEEMREWLEENVRRIRQLQPGHVLEIGCGTGLILFQLAPECESYLGTDFSEAAIRFLQRGLVSPAFRTLNISFARRAADDLQGLSNVGFDTVILNSVAQYFPSVEYLRHVIEGAAAAIRGPGAIFLGDIRSLPLLEGFHASVQLHQAPYSLSPGQLQRRIRTRVDHESELAVDPAFFISLQRSLPGIGHVEVLPKFGSSRNELSAFRYDVILHVNADPEPLHVENWLDWRSQRLSVETLRQTLLSSKPEVLGITGVRNERCREASSIVKLLASRQPPESVASLAEAARIASPEVYTDPDALHALAEELSYSLQMNWGRHGSDGAFDVVFHRRRETSPATLAVNWPNGTRGDFSVDSEYANNPLDASFAQRFVPEIRKYLSMRLPDYMVPSSFTLLDSLPLNPNGKLNRRALPDPDTDRPELEQVFTPPATETEKLFASLWSQVLVVERVGINDNFFQLGGDSIHSIQIVARANQAGLSISVRDIFQHQTIAELAAFCDAQAPVKGEAGAKAESQLPSPAELIAARGEIAETYPLSPGQQDMLRYYLSDTKPGLYVVQDITSLQGVRFDLEVLRKALLVLTKRYPALRTSFLWEGLEEPLQLIHEQAEMELEYQDCRGLSIVELEKILSLHLREDRKRGWNLKRPLSWRTLVVQIADDSWIFSYSYNYMLLDGWSYYLLIGELTNLYRELSAKRTPATESSSTYKDYVLWAKSQDLGAAERFWRKELQGFHEPLSLNRSSMRRLLESPLGLKQLTKSAFSKWIFETDVDQHSATLPDHITEKLHSLARAHQIPLSSVVTSAWAIVAGAYGETDDVVFGVGFTGRPPSLPGIEQGVGRMLTTLPVRVRLKGEQPLLSWFSELQFYLMEIMQYQHAPLWRVHEWSEVPAEKPIFESYLIYQNLQSLEFISRENQAPQSAAFAAQARLLPSFYSRDQHSVRVQVMPPGLGVVLTNYGSCFAGSTINGMLESFLSLLEEVAGNPQQTVAEWKRRTGLG